MTTKRDYYEILGISKNASQEEIKSAFRRLAFQYHPDRNPDFDAESRFKELNEAFKCVEMMREIYIHIDRRVYVLNAVGAVEHKDGVLDALHADLLDVDISFVSQILNVNHTIKVSILKFRVSSFYLSSDSPVK